jgi:hypothetical protein
VVWKRRGVGRLFAWKKTDLMAAESGKLRGEIRNI